jgi:hypothetical protein
MRLLDKALARFSARHAYKAGYAAAQDRLAPGAWDDRYPPNRGLRVASNVRAGERVLLSGDTFRIKHGVAFGDSGVRVVSVWEATWDRGLLTITVRADPEGAP